MVEVPTTNAPLAKQYPTLINIIAEHNKKKIIALQREGVRLNTAVLLRNTISLYSTIDHIPDDVLNDTWSLVTKESRLALLESIGDGVAFFSWAHEFLVQITTFAWIIRNTTLREKNPRTRYEKFLRGIDNKCGRGHAQLLEQVALKSD